MYGCNGVRIPSSREARITLSRPISRVIHTATALRDSASAWRIGIGPLNSLS